MKITIVGAGNIGTQFAVFCAEKGHKVTIYTSKPEKIANELTIVNENNVITHRGKIVLATNEPAKAFNFCDLIFVTMPAPLMDFCAKQILPNIKSNVKICLVPGSGGGECAFKKCIEKGAIIFGLQRVPSVARLEEYGKTVKATGYRNKLFVGSLPQKYAIDCSKLIQDIFDITTQPLPNYLNLTLVPSNPILHTTRLRTLFKDYKFGHIYERIPLFYQNWDNESSELLLKCDNEVQMICRKLTDFDLTFVKSLQEHYESYSAETLTAKLTNIESLKGLESPQIKLGEHKFLPDFNSRYFTADFPYGLSILIQIAEMLEVNATYMKETMNWYKSLIKETTEFKYTNYNIRSYLDFYKFYSQ